MLVIVYALYILGIAAFVQGLGGLTNRLVQSDGPSWFLQLHIIPSSQRGLQIAASIVLILVGLGLFAFSTKKAKQHKISLD